MIDETILPAVRWNLVISASTNVLVRSFLAQRGVKKWDLSSFVEEAVRLRVIELTLAGDRAGTHLADPDVAQTVMRNALLERNQHGWCCEARGWGGREKTNSQEATLIGVVHTDED